MRIGIDAREIVGQATGVGRYLSGLLTDWAATGATSRHEFFLYAHAPIPSAPPQFTARIVPGTSGTWWQQVALPAAARRDTLDVFFAPQYTAPLAPDSHRRRHLRRLVCRASRVVSHARRPPAAIARAPRARRARAVVTISQFSRTEIAEHLGVPDRRIHVIPPGVPVRSTSAAFERGSRLLYAGSIFNRRHVPDLIRAFAHVARAHREASLDLVGDNRSYPYQDITAAIDREELGDRIRWHRFATDDQLSELYGKARGFAFLSEYEGLGLTPLEALSAGVPPVLFDTAIARESCGDAALYVRPGDLNGVSRAIERLLFDDSTHDALLAAAGGALAKYDWSRAARETLALLERW